MRRQITRPVRESDAERGRLYLPQVDTLWLPVTIKELKNMDLFDSREVVVRLGLEPINQRLVLAVSKADLKRLKDNLGIQEIPINDLFATLATCPSAISAFRVPTASLDKSWLYAGTIDDESAIRLTLKLAIKMKHVSFNPDNTLSTDGTLDALRLGYGNCFFQVAVLAAAFRKNGIPARIVGRRDFFGEENGDHWWVEAFVEGEWRFYDPRINDVFLERVLRVAGQRRLDENGTIQTVWDSIAQLTGASKRRITPTEDRAYAEKTEFHVIAAEIPAQ